MSKTIIIDFSNIVQACFRQAIHQDGIDLEEVPPGYEGHLDNLRMKLGSLFSIFLEPFGLYVFAEDRKPIHKYEIFPGYKAGRKSGPFDPRPSSKAWIKAHSTWHQASWVHSPDHEADDVIATLVEQDPGAAIIVSNDQDLWQLISPRVDVFDHIKKEYVLRPHINEKFGVADPRQIALVKTLWGDTTDRIPNIAPRMRPIFMPLVRNTDGSWHSFWIECNSKPLPPKARALITQSSMIRNVFRNINLAYLKKNCPLVYDKR